MSRFMRDAVTLHRLRRLLAILILLGLLGTAAELLLVNHIEDARQWTPVILIALAVPVLLWLTAAPSRAAVRGWQALMFAFIISGGIGLWLHWQAKIEFKQETDASLTGAKLFWESLKSVSPPALAPAAMIHLGLLGLLCIYRHPSLRAADVSNLALQGENE